jgi:Cu2+-exporting ATPase
VADVNAENGRGLCGIVDGHDVVVGRPDWVRAQCHTNNDALDRALNAYAHDGHTPVAVAVDGRLAAALAFGDRLRSDSRALLQQLREEGNAVYVLSGDHPHVVHAVARQLDMKTEHVQGHVSPEAKQTFVERLQSEGRVVAMIGDGVNDAAALQAADVGVAVEGGSTASLVAADVFLTRDGLQPVNDLFDGAHHVMRVVRRNLGFSLGYNLLGALAAMSGLVGPLVAAIAMPISSLVVVAASILQGSFCTLDTPEDAPRTSGASPSDRDAIPHRPAPAQSATHAASAA